MRVQNGRLVALVAAVAVAAITGGGALASRQGPANANGPATPLSTSPSTAPSTPAATTTAAKPTPAKMPPSTMPSSTTPSSTTRSSTPTGLVKTKIDLKKLAQGRAPQVTYLAGRTIRGGAGEDIKVPGNAQIQAVARVGRFSLAVVTKGFGTEMLSLDNSTGEISRRTPDITDIVTTDDGTAAAYIGTKLKSTGEEVAGVTVYADQGGAADVQKISVPGLWNNRLYGYLDGKVYFGGSTTQTGRTALYEWTPGEQTASILKAVPQPLSMSSASTAGSHHAERPEQLQYAPRRSDR
jgi:hypothetical protein